MFAIIIAQPNLSPTSQGVGRGELIQVKAQKFVPNKKGARNGVIG